MVARGLVVRRAVPGALAAAVLLLAADASAATRHVGSADEFHAAVASYRSSGGTIVLRAGKYPRPLVVGPRSSRRLTIRGPRSARIHSLLLDRAQAVTVRGLTVRPIGGVGGVLARRSRAIVFDRLHFTARGSTHRVALDLERSRGVIVRNSRFSNCGDGWPGIAPCLFPRWASHVTVRGNRFHDCRGCDFVHGRAGRGLVVEENRFERAPPCNGAWKKCGHQDAIELFLGDGVIIRRNLFGSTGHGRGQIFLSRSTHRVRIVNNVFLRDGPEVAGITPRRGIVVGSRVHRDLPRDVRILNNTVLSGNRPGDEEAASIVISPFYLDAPASIRPLVANNVVARLRATHICQRVRRSVRNVVMRGGPCSPGDRVGDPTLADDGRPTAASELLIDRAAPAFAPPRDVVGRARVGPPDIGAYEFSP